MWSFWCRRPWQPLGCCSCQSSPGLFHRQLLSQPDKSNHQPIYRAVHVYQSQNVKKYIYNQFNVLTRTHIPTTLPFMLFQYQIDLSYYLPTVYDMSIKKYVYIISLISLEKFTKHNSDRQIIFWIFSCVMSFVFLYTCTYFLMHVYASLLSYKIMFCTCRQS